MFEVGLLVTLYSPPFASMPELLERDNRSESSGNDDSSSR